MRTSETHPLYINWIPVEGDKGKIGITLCPGKYQPVSSTGAWNRDSRNFGRRVAPLWGAAVKRSRRLFIKNTGLC